MVYSVFFRCKALKHKNDNKLTIQETADYFKIGYATVVRWLKRLHPKTTRDRKSPNICYDALKQDIIDYPDSFYYERAKRFNVGKTSIFRAMKKLKSVIKKNIKSSKMSANALLKK